MAAEEVNKSLSLPPYPEMILEAIDALKEKDGSNKSAISKYIESTYGALPEGHSSLLSDHLNRMKDSGQLVFAKNNYMKFDPNAPPRRGRGRPRKDPNAPPPPKKVATPSSSGSGRPRGRPPKNGGTAGGSTGPKSGRPRGRPPKMKAQQQERVGVEAS